MSGFEYYRGNDSRITDELNKLINQLKELKEDDVERKEVKFHFFQFGGCGQSYNANHVLLMREIQKLGGYVGNIVGPVNKYKDSALLLAACHDDYEFMEFLLENGADPYEQRYDSKDTFDYCDKKGLEIISKFYEIPKERKN